MDITAQNLCFLPPNFNEQLLIPRRESWFPLGNDKGLVGAYGEAIATVPTVDQGKQPIALLVGFGGFDIAAEMLPPEVQIIQLDVDPQTLFYQCFLKQLAVNARSEKELFRNILASTDWLPFKPRTSLENQLSTRVSIVERHPLDFSTEQCKTTDNLFARRHAIAARSIAYAQVDLRDGTAIAEFGTFLSERNAQIVLANVTNVFDKHFCGGYQEIFYRELPFHPKAPVITSTTDQPRRIKLLAVVRDIPITL